MNKLDGVIETRMGKVVITDGKIDTINGCPIEAGTIASQKAVAKAVAEVLLNE
jgi:hypothetical protein